MSTELYEDSATGIVVTTYCGKVRPDGGERKRVQISKRIKATKEGHEALFITLSKEEYLALAEFIGQEVTIYPEG